MCVWFILTSVFWCIKPSVAAVTQHILAVNKEDCFWSAHVAALVFFFPDIFFFWVWNWHQKNCNTSSTTDQTQWIKQNSVQTTICCHLKHCRLVFPAISVIAVLNVKIVRMFRTVHMPLLWQKLILCSHWPTEKRIKHIYRRWLHSRLASPHRPCLVFPSSVCVFDKVHCHSGVLSQGLVPTHNSNGLGVGLNKKKKKKCNDI